MYRKTTNLTKSNFNFCHGMVKAEVLYIGKRKKKLYVSKVMKQRNRLSNQIYLYSEKNNMELL